MASGAGCPLLLSTRPAYSTHPARLALGPGFDPYPVWGGWTPSASGTIRRCLPAPTRLSN